MQYNTVGGIVTKQQAHTSSINGSPETDYSLSYTYSTAQPHALDEVTDGTYTYVYSYDANGNMTQKTQDTDPIMAALWDEADRMRAVRNLNGISHYIYDANGQRLMKGGIDMDFASFDSQEMPGGGWVVKPYTVYVNPYFVYNGDGYVQDISPDRFTKHYYAGSERIASRLNREGQNATEHTTSTIYSPTAAYAPVLVNLQAALSDFGLNDQLDTDPAGYPLNPIEAPEDCEEQFGNDQMEIERCLCLHFPAEAALQSIECYGYEPIYWYHPDYLGHTDFVTDRTGQPYQHFFYAPFGEALLSQHTGTGYYNTPYRFNAKELDSETGLIYYGARYYEPKESVWLSVDPLAGKSPHQSSYHFVSNNPVMRIDPDGREDGWYIDESGNVIGRDKNLFDDRIYFVYGNDVDKVKADNFENGVSQASLSNPIELPTLEERNRLKMVYQYGLEDRNQEFGMITEKSESGKIASRLYRSSQPFKRNSQGGSGSISFLPSEIISSEGYTNEYTLENWHFSVLAHTHNINESRQPPTPHSDKLPANFNVGIVFDYYSGGHNTYIFNHSTKFRSKSRMNTNSFFSPFITPDGKAL